MAHAAALYAPHRFAEMCTLLEPWRRQLAADPLLVTALTRVKVFNTLGRALVALGNDGWAPLFHESEAILEELEPTDLPRTWCYLAQGHLREGRLDLAEKSFHQIERHPGLGDVSRWSLRALQADAARRRGEVWTDPEMELCVVSGRVGHPFAFYLQATARQPGRDLADSHRRFARSCEFLCQDKPEQDGRNIQRFLVECVRAAACAWGVDPDGWFASLAAIERYVDAAPHYALREHYCGHLPASESVPDRAVAERLLSRVPFF